MKPCYGLNTLARSGGTFGGVTTCGSYFLAAGLQLVRWWQVCTVWRVFVYRVGLYRVGGVCVRSVQSVPRVCSDSPAPAVALVSCTS